jgi:hypothetical protein
VRERHDVVRLAVVRPAAGPEPRRVVRDVTGAGAAAGALPTGGAAA